MVYFFGGFEKDGNTLFTKGGFLLPKNSVRTSAKSSVQSVEDVEQQKVVKTSKRLAATAFQPSVEVTGTPSRCYRAGAAFFFSPPVNFFGFAGCKS